MELSLLKKVTQGQQDDEEVAGMTSRKVLDEEEELQTVDYQGNSCLHRSAAVGMRLIAKLTSPGDSWNNLRRRDVCWLVKGS